MNQHSPSTSGLTKADIFDGRPFKEVFRRLESQPRIQSVEFIEMLSANEFHRRVLPDEYPVVFATPTLLPSMDEVLQQLKGLGAEIDVRRDNYALPNMSPLKRDYVKMTLSEYIETHLFSSGTGLPPYAGNLTALDIKLSEPPDFYPAGHFEPPSVWLGSAGCVTPLHKDGSKNFAIHLFGSKRWTLFPPRDAESLYLTRILEESDYATSSIDLANVDLERFPLFREAQSVSVTVEQNQILFLPEGWAHFVENLEPTLMVNYWHKNRGE